VSVRLYSHYVRPHREFAAPVWSPMDIKRQRMIGKSADGSGVNGTWADRNNLRGKTESAGPDDPGGMKAQALHDADLQESAREGKSED
jgi:hypothetical protein